MEGFTVNLVLSMTSAQCGVDLLIDRTAGGASGNSWVTTGHGM